MQIFFPFSVLFSKYTYLYRMISVLFRKYLYTSPLRWSILSYLTDQGCSQVTTLGMLVNVIWAERDLKRACAFGWALCLCSRPWEEHTPVAADPAAWAMEPRAQPRPAQQASVESVNPPASHKEKWILVLLRWFVTQQKLTNIYEHIITLLLKASVWKFYSFSVTISFPSTCSTTLLPLSLLIHLIETSSPYSFSTRLFLVSHPT